MPIALSGLGKRFGAFHENYDVLVTPTMPIAAFEVGSDVPPGWHSPDWTSWTPYTYIFNMTQQPALTLPCGVTDAGLPVGVQLVGAAGQHLDRDAQLLGHHAVELGFRELDDAVDEIAQHIGQVLVGRGLEVLPGEG